MRAISLKIPEQSLQEAEKLASALGMSRAAFIRTAVERFSAEVATDLRARRLAAASEKVRDESMRINAQFAAIERDVDSNGERGGDRAIERGAAPEADRDPDG